MIRKGGWLTLYRLSLKINAAYMNAQGKRI